MSAFIRDTFLNTGSATSGGGTMVVNFPTNGPPYNDHVVRWRFAVYSTSGTGGHLGSGAAFLAECVTFSKNGTVTFGTAISTSSNPINSNTTGFELTSRVECADTSLGTSTVVITIATNILTITITNNGSSGSTPVNIAMVTDVEYWST
jgi:hypothetical protein